MIKRSFLGLVFIFSLLVLSGCDENFNSDNYHGTVKIVYGKSIYESNYKSYVLVTIDEPLPDGVISQDVLTICYSPLLDELRVGDRVLVRGLHNSGGYEPVVIAKQTDPPAQELR